MTTTLPVALKRYASKIDSVDVDSDGWKFVYLKRGWIRDGVHQVSGTTWNDCARGFSIVEPCDYDCCKGKE